MLRLRIDQDIKPLSELRTALAHYIKQVHETKRPLVITQHGKSVAVLMDAHEFESMQENIDRLSSLEAALARIESGLDTPLKKALQDALSQIRE